jgi:hypothetical protein
MKLPRVDNVDGTLALLQIGELAKRLCRDADGIDLEWAATYSLIKQIPKTAATLSLRSRVESVRKNLDAASRTLHSICDSLHISREVFPLPGELPPDDSKTEGQ